MEQLNNNPKETGAAPAPTPAPAANTPPAAAAPAVTPAPVEAANGLIPQTSGKTPGGWNRFAGYKRSDPKNNQKDRRESRGRR